MKVLAIDPGPEESAYMVFDAEARRPVRFEIKRNACDTYPSLVDYVGANGGRYDPFKDICDADHLAIEMVASYGMAVGASVFDTCVWIGRFVQAWEQRKGPGSWTLVYRREIKLHLCGDSRAKDSNIRAALIDLYGGKEKAIGKKATPGPLHGVSSDVWSALAIAVTWADTKRESKEVAA